MIPFNKPYLSGNEITYINEAISLGKLSGDGIFTQKCHQFFNERYKIRKSLLTTSCTDALELAALLLNISDKDEIIAPSFTFVSSVNPFLLRGAKVNFVDSHADHPNMDETLIEAMITPQTKAIVVVHYAGVACHMDHIMKIAQKYNLYVVEDAAQAIDSYYRNTPLGSIGQLASFSFHETKNIISGEGGLLAINAGEFALRAEILREKGTNRSAFFRGEVDKYGWVDVGSSFLPSEIIAAFLYAQLENLERIQKKRLDLWQAYDAALKMLTKKGILLPYIPEFATNNAHMYYLVCNNPDERTKLIEHLKKNGIHAVFHYQSLHNSPYYSGKNKRLYLPQADRFSDCLLRLPLYYELTLDQVNQISEKVKEFYEA